MEIIVTKSFPSPLEVVEILKREFSGRYSYELCLEKKSIFVGRSTSVKAQITVQKNQMIVQTAYRSLIEDIIIFLCQSELGVFLIPLFFQKEMQLHAQRTKLKREISLFLKRTYN